VNLHKAIDELCSSCEEVGRLSQCVDSMYAANKLEKAYSEEEISKKELELHGKTHKCNNLRIEIEDVCSCGVELKRPSLY